jgi:ParB family chromosome partitioning protein
MPGNEGQSFTLPARKRPNSDLFSTQDARDDAQREKVQEILLDLIDGFPDHPFHVREDEAMQAMVESVRKSGVLTPAVVRPKDDGRYELVSGHRRKRAAALAGLETLPVLVREMTRDEAIIFMVESNLQRETVLPSEKAFAYKMRLDAMKRQAGRPSKENPRPVVGNLESADILGEQTGDCGRQIQRFIRLTALVPALLQLVDDNKIAFRPAVELSYLQENEQAALLEAMQAQDATPSLAQALKMKAFSQNGQLSEAVILSIMEEEKPNQKVQFKMPMERVSKFFAPGTPAQTMADTIVKAVPFYLQRQREKKREGPGL